jgi:hypothetical protein
MPIDTEWNEEQSKKIAVWLLEKWGPARKCTQCEASDWTVSTYPALIQIEKNWGFSAVHRKAYPCVAVMCNNCGHMVFVNALRAGIVDASESLEATDVR